MRTGVLPSRANRALLCLAVLAVAVVTSCASGSATRHGSATQDGGASAPNSSTSGATVAASPQLKACRQNRCAAGRTVPLRSSYAIRVWNVPGVQAHPTLELLSDGAATQWLILKRGSGDHPALTCNDTGAVANCIVVSATGMHSALAEMVLLLSGRLDDTGAVVVAQTPTLHAADLDGDGYLDLAARDSDYKPNFAQGHLFDRTFRYDRKRNDFVVTGCSPLLRDPNHARPPVRLQTASCPTI